MLTTRRLMLAGLAAPLAGCAAPLAPLLSEAVAPDARALLDASAAAHGLAALSRIGDVSVSYVGGWYGLVQTLQPDLVDSPHRGRSQERLLLAANIAASAHEGTAGRKQVFRRAAPKDQGVTRLWFDGIAAQDRPRRDAAALVADGYGLFLFGPMLPARLTAEGRPMAAALAGAETIEVGGVDHACDVLRLRLAPGLGMSDADDLALFIDRDARLMRRVRFSLQGLESTRGAVAEVDCWAHLDRHGVRWPTRFHERLLRPVPLDVHDWRMTGLDIDRGFSAADLDGPAFSGRAVPPAADLPS